MQHCAPYKTAPAIAQSRPIACFVLSSAKRPWVRHYLGLVHMFLIEKSRTRGVLQGQLLLRLVLQKIKLLNPHHETINNHETIKKGYDVMMHA